jgi:excisionase family DNA binding protein
MVTLREAAEFLRVQPITLYRLLKKQQIPGAFKIGRVWRFDLDKLERFLQERPRERG